MSSAELNYAALYPHGAREGERSLRAGPDETISFSQDSESHTRDYMDELARRRNLGVSRARRRTESRSVAIALYR